MVEKCRYGRGRVRGGSCIYDGCWYGYVGMRIAIAMRRNGRSILAQSDDLSRAIFTQRKDGM
jgi:hypothetical protein